MSKNFRLTLNKEPRNIALETTGESGFTALFAIGIVNPMGPTLNVVGADGLGEVGDVLPLVHLMLNPFSQECLELGAVEIGESWNPATDLEPVFSLPLGACPTLLLPSALYSGEVARSVFAALLQNFDDGSDVLGKIRRFPGDPWERINMEMAGLRDLLKSSPSGPNPGRNGRQLTAAEAREVAETQLQERNLGQEFNAFMAAWEGSINFSGMSAMAMSQEDFLAIFGRVALTLRLPFMRNIIDSPDILES